MSKLTNLTKYIYIAILALVAILALIVIASSADIFGHRTYVVRTGSMSPSIPAGSVVFDARQSTYKIGNVITFIEPGMTSANSSDLVTHRIVAIQKEGVVTYYQVKGDANKAPDANLVPNSNVVGVVKHSIPKIGYLVSFIKSLPGIIIFIIIPATIIVYEELGNIKDEVIRLRNEAKTIQKATAKKVRKIEKVAVKEEAAADNWLKRFLSRFRW
jgi:signal peptidase